MEYMRVDTDILYIEKLENIQKRLLEKLNIKHEVELDEKYINNLQESIKKLEKKNEKLKAKQSNNSNIDTVMIINKVDPDTKGLSVLLSDPRREIIINKYLFFFPKPSINLFFKKHLPKYYIDDVANCQSINLSNLNLSQSNFSKASFKNAFFKEANLKEVILDNVDLDNSDLTKVKKLKSKQLAKALFVSLNASDKKTQLIIRKAINQKKKIKINSAKQLKKIIDIFAKYNLESADEFFDNKNIIEKDKLFLLEIMKQDQIINMLENITQNMRTHTTSINNGK